MAVYTDVTDEDLAAFLAAYDVGALLSFKGIAEGVENSNYLVQTERGSYILTLYEKRVDPADLPFFLGLMQHLAAGGLNCPTPLINNDGKMLGELAGRPAALVSFLNGVWTRRPKMPHCFELGAGMAQMHVIGADFALKRDNALSVSGWGPLLDDCRARGDEVRSGLVAELEGELAQLQALWPQDLPQGVIHADLFPDNVFFIGETLSGLIDFYFACNDSLAYDIAICLNAWCFELDGAFNVTKAKALLSGYNSVRPLSSAEMAALPVLCRGAALRFLLTRLYDWLRVPEGALVTPKDPLEYLGKLRFHRSVVSPSAYGLDA
ncbi:homoserine kinase [Polycladidibacter hongkongensis]|uniref:homoserine kinase n=1 Tax=Polycladidibacter hongkongensis TaxID=1647556 RepID=UPI0008367480|nr:homoserine kinase [Pseudovibrio hongkongensis]